MSRVDGAHGVPSPNVRALPAVPVLSRDHFVLWVNAKSPYQNPKQYIDAVKAAGPALDPRGARRHMGYLVRLSRPFRRAFR